MGRLTALLIGQFRAWERPAQMAMGLALALLALALLALVLSPSDWRQPIMIGFIGLIFVTQAIFMWANRSMVTPFTRAQRQYLAGDLAGALATLEPLVAAESPDVRALTLLGNTYRQVGRLEESARILTKAIGLRPFDPFPLYGFGRTLLVSGQYIEAVTVLRQALEAGAVPAVQVDLAEALYRQGLGDEARALLELNKDAAYEPHRQLMVDYMLYRLGTGVAPAPDRIENGLPFWKESANRFAHTPYGQALADDVRQMQSLVEEA